MTRSTGSTWGHVGRGAAPGPFPLELCAEGRAQCNGAAHHNAPRGPPSPPVSLDSCPSLQADIGGTWLSVPWASLSAGLKDALSTQYGVRGIPHFVVLSPDGQLICKEGRNAVMQDPSGLMFPWAV